MQNDVGLDFLGLFAIWKIENNKTTHTDARNGFVTNRRRKINMFETEKKKQNLATQILLGSFTVGDFNRNVRLCAP